MQILISILIIKTYSRTIWSNPLNLNFVKRILSEAKNSNHVK